MGGMAEIFRARTATIGFEKRVCIKRVLPHYLEDDDFVTMFRDEARTAAKLQHANVVQVFDFGEVDDEGAVSLFLAMELIEGCDLRRAIDASRKKKIPFELGEVVQIGIDVCRGLHHAHSLQENGKALGVVHRDISPHNILLSRNGEVKVADFGIAKAAERATHTSTGIVKGKVAYMSPEQAEGKAFDHRLDQWATGVVLWELLCGERLFHGENDVTILRKVLNVDVPPPSSLRVDLPLALEEIVLRALQADPADRFADMRHMELALSRFLHSGLVDPTSAEVRNVFTRIVDVDGESAARRTNVIPAPSLGLDPPVTERLEDIAKITSSTQDDPELTSSSEGSAVFSTSAKHRRAPAPAPLGNDDDAAAAFAQRPTSSQPRSAEALLDEVTRVRDQDESAVRPADDDGTPATRTLVPVSQKNPLALSPSSPLPSPPASRVPLLAAAGILATGAVVAFVIAFGTSQPAPVEAVAAVAPLKALVARPFAVPDPPAPPAVEVPEKVSDAGPGSKASETEVAERPKAPGTVFVDVPNSWARVFLGKKPLGETPVTLTLPAGRYNITLENDDGSKRKTVPVVVGSGTKSQIRTTF